MPVISKQAIELAEKFYFEWEDDKILPNEILILESERTGRSIDELVESISEYLKG